MSRSARFIPLRFESERIVLTVLDDAVAMEGHYVYKWEGRGAASVLLHAPVTVDEAHPWPRSMRASCEGGLLPSLRLGDRLWFLVPVVPGETTVVDLRYEQERLDDSFTYILTTTQSWQRPIARSELIVVAPGVTAIQANLPLASAGQGRWRGLFREFWPTADLEVRLLQGG